MNYFIGQQLLWRPSQHHKAVERVTVTALRKRGSALLSNGWVVDEDGIAAGTKRIPGGSVSEPNSERLEGERIGS